MNEVEPPMMNVPGVLAHANERRPAASINLAVQYRGINEDVGYLAIGVDGAASQPALGELCAVSATIRRRILY